MNFRSILPQLWLVSLTLAVIVWPTPTLPYDLVRVEHFSIETQSKDVEDAQSLLVSLSNGEELAIRLTPVLWFDQISYKGALPSADLQIYEGHITGRPNSWVRITIDGDVILGLINDGHRRFEITNLKRGAPLKSNFSASRRDARSYNLNVVNSPVSGKGYSRVVPIAIVVDELFNKQYFGRGLAQALNIINGVDGIFRQELGVAVRLDIAITTNDEPFTKLPGASPSQLSGFSEFRKRIPELQGDIALVHLFTGSALPTFSGAGVGYAFIGSVCGTSGLDVSVSAPYYRGIELAAHEIAHNLGALHDKNTDGCKTDTSKLMDTIIDGATQLSSCSVDRIEATLARTGCHLEVHDGAIFLRASGKSAVAITVESRSTLDSTVYPEVHLTYVAPVKKAPSYCQQPSMRELNCTLPGLKSNSVYQFIVEFENASQNEVLAEYTDGASVDINNQNNTAEIILTGASSPISQCVDTDGDGFGWNGQATCLPVPTITDNQQAPQYTDLRTGRSIYLTRSTWTVADLTNRTIECRPYAYDRATNQYLVNPSVYTRYRHLPVNQNTNTGTTEIARYVRGSNQVFSASALSYRDWSVDGGYYHGPAPFARSPYLQIVSAGSGNNNAIRSYSSSNTFDLCTSFPDSSVAFRPGGSTTADVYQCRDTEPLNDGWGWNGASSCRVPITNATSTTASPNTPTVVITTSGPVVLDGILSSEEWRAATTTDTTGSVLGLPVAISGLRSERDVDRWMIMHDLNFIYIAITVPDSTPWKDSTLTQHDDSVELFIDGGNQRANRYDADDTHLILRETGHITGVSIQGARFAHARRYDSSKKQYTYEIQLTKASLQLSGGEFGFDMQVNNDQNGGSRDAKWGWAGRAGSNTHWFRMSSVGNACLDTGPLSENCQRTTIASNNCVDTGVIGDGWGWNGTASCRLDTLSELTCVDTGVIGDGWGWNGNASCRLH